MAEAAVANVDPFQAPRSADQAHDDQRLARARRQVAAIKGFYIHLVVFVVVLAGLAVVNLAVGDPWWVQWVLLGWGIGVAAHALAVFGHASQVMANWEKRKLDELMRRQ
jgi:hypothetical protein